MIVFENLMHEKIMELINKHQEIIEKEFQLIIKLGYKNSELGLMVLNDYEYKIFLKKTKEILSYFKIENIFYVNKNRGAGFSTEGK